MVLGGRNGAKMDISSVLGGMRFEALFLSEFYKFFDQIEGEKQMVF